jgi:glutaconate CoA-transferase subunit A
MTLRFMAGAMGLPYIVTKSGLETDIVNATINNNESRQSDSIKDKKLKVIDNPFESKNSNVVALKPLNPDVTILHAQYAGEDGTIRIEGLSFADIEQAKAAKKVIISCEHVVPENTLRQIPTQKSIPNFLVDAIVHSPMGAHPTACYNFYDYDPVHLNMFKKIGQSDELFKKYLNEWVFPFDNQEDYLEKVGAKNIINIRANPAFGYSVGLIRK